jgi:hypothetical protein
VKNQDLCYNFIFWDLYQLSSKENGVRCVSFCKNVISYVVSWNCIRVHDVIRQIKKCAKIFQEIKHYFVYSNRALFKISVSVGNRIVKSLVEIENFSWIQWTHNFSEKILPRNKITCKIRECHILSSQHRTYVGRFMVKNEERCVRK